MPCQDCNNNTPYQVYNNQTTYANSCIPSECGGKLTNAKCVYYSGPTLPCTGVAVNDSLELVLQKMDEKICTTAGDYSTYNTYCLAPISTQREFVETISSYVCTNKALFDTFVGTTFTAYQASVNSRFLAIEIPLITCSFAGVTTADSLQDVLNKYCTAFGTLNSAISLSGVNWSQCFTITTPPATIANAFSLLVDQICQVKALSSTLPVFNNTGSCLPSPGTSDTLVSTIEKIKTRLCQTGTFDYTALTFGCVTPQTSLQDTVQQILSRVDDYIKNKLTFSADFVVTQTDSGNACLGKTVALTTPIVGNDKLVATSATDNTPGYLLDKLVGTGVITVTEIGSNPTKQLQISSSAISTVAHTDSYSIALTGSGTSGSPLIANVKVSATAGNQLSINSDGLFVATLATTYTFNTTNSITLTNAVNTITADVKVDNSVPNLITVGVNGLVVTPQTFTQTPISVVSTNSLSLAVSGTDNHTLTGNVAISSTVGNAITINSDGLFVPGATAITLTTTGTSGAATYVGSVLNIPNYTSNAYSGLTQTGVNIVLGGSLAANTTIDSGTTYSFVVKATLLSANHNAWGIRGQGVLGSNGTETQQFAVTGVYGHLDVKNTGGTFTAYALSKHGALSGTVYKSSTGHFTGILSSVVGCTEFQDSGNVTTVASFRAIAPELTEATTYTGAITNAVGLYIDDISTSTVVAQITNKYSIYQVGATDINLLNGKLIMVNLPVYADNTAAASLPTGQFYRTATGVVMVRY
ncbi:MAG: hypothetical protein WCP46_00645 [Alphaproteobacteria bacterium]